FAADGRRGGEEVAGCRRAGRGTPRPEGELLREPPCGSRLKGDGSNGSDGEAVAGVPRAADGTDEPVAGSELRGYGLAHLDEQILGVPVVLAGSGDGGLVHVAPVVDDHVQLVAEHVVGAVRG